MDLKAKRKAEMDNQKQKRKEEVVNAAVEVLKEKGIENTKMTDIAEKAEVGIASVYRYFKTKPELVIEAAVRFWEEEIASLYCSYVNEDFNRLNGIGKVRNALEIFVVLYRNHKNFMRFIEEFDNYVIKERISADRLEEYEENIVSLKPIILNTIKMGKEDGTIEKDINENLFYITITHSLMSLCQKLILRGNVIRSDMDFEGEDEIRLAIEMAVEFIRNKKKEIKNE